MRAQHTPGEWALMSNGTLRRMGPNEIDVYAVCVGPKEVEWKWRIWGNVDGINAVLSAGDNCRSQAEAIYLAAQSELERRLTAELRGSPDSVLWGQSGLIAATMRCVDHLQATEGDKC